MVFIQMKAFIYWFMNFGLNSNSSLGLSPCNIFQFTLKYVGLFNSHRRNYIPREQQRTLYCGQVNSDKLVGKRVVING